MLLELKHKSYYSYDLKIQNILVIENLDYKISNYFDNIKHLNYLNLLLFSLKDYYIKIDLPYEEKRKLIEKYIIQYIKDLNLDENKLEEFILNSINGNINYYDDYNNKILKVLNTVCNIVYYCDLDLVKFTYSKIPKLFHKDIKFEFYEGLFNLPNYNLLKASLESLKYDTIKHLIKEHKFCFYENILNNNFDSIIYKKSKKNVDNLLEIIELDNINNYINLVSFNDYLLKIQKSSSEKVTIKIFELLCQDDRNKENIVNLIINSIYNVKYQVIKYIFNSDYFKNTLIEFITYQEWITFANNVHRFEDEFIHNFYDNEFYNTKSRINNEINKSKIAYIIIKIIYSFEKEKKDKIVNTIILDNYDKNFYGNFIRLPNIIPSLKIIHQSLDINNFYNKENIIVNLFRYGYLETIKYFFDELLPEDDFQYIKNRFRIEMLEMSLYNKNNKVCDYVLSKINFDNYNYCRYSFINYEFIKFYKIKQDNKIKKLKIINKHYDIRKNKEVIISCLLDFEFAPYINQNIKLIDYCVAKLLDNKIQKENFRIILLIAKLGDLNILKKYLSMVDFDINIWKIIISSLEFGYCFYDYYIQYLISIAKPLSDQPSHIKKDFYNKVICYREKTEDYLRDNLNYNDIEIKKYESYLTLEKYINILKYCQINGINLNEKFNSFDYETIIKISNTSNEKMLNAGIIMGISFKPLIKKHESIFIHYNYTKYKKQWIKLYYIIKHLEFVKKYRSRKNHCNMFTSSVVEIESKPPLQIEDKPILKKGGHLFYRDLDEFDILSDNYKTFIKPKHIQFYEMYNLSKKEIYLSQKTDGVLVKNIDKNNIYPPLDSKFNNIVLDAEYIPQLNLYLIFNQRSNYNENRDYLDDYYDLYSSHDYCIENIKLFENIFKSSDNKDKIEKKLDLEIINIQNFLRQNNNNSIGNKILWYPKIFWRIEEISNNLNTISIMEKYLVDYNLQTDKLIKNDGIIIMEANNKDTIYKYKPKNEMTADLKFGNDIWRCKWNNNKWEKNEIRKDKQYPNPKYVIDILEKYHNNPWCVDDIIDYLSKYQSIFYYQVKYNNFRNYFNKEYFGKYKNIINKIYYSLGMKNSNILDLGCGYLNNIFWKEDYNIDGIDIDLGIIEKFNTLSGKNTKKVYIKDISQISTKLDFNWLEDYNLSLPIEKKYDLVISNMSFHNVFKNENGFSNMIEFLNKNTRVNCQMIMTFIDKKLLFKLDNYIDLLNGSYIRKINDNAVKIYYTWTQNKPIVENILDYENITNLMKEKGWIVKEDLSKMINNIKLNENNPWGQVKDSIKIINFIKNN